MFLVGEISLFSVVVSERMGVSDNLGFYCFAEGFWDLLDLINTVNLVDNMALLNWNSGIFNNWVLYAVFRYNFVARGSDGFFMSIYVWDNCWGSISIPGIGISVTLGNNMSVRVSWGSYSVSAMLAGDFLAQFFVFDRLSNNILGFTNGFSSWCANLSGDFFVFDLAVWCNNSWGNYGWGNNSWGNSGWGNNLGGFYKRYACNWKTSQKQLWVSVSISSWSSKADSQDTGEDDYLKKIKMVLKLQQSLMFWK